jgi:glutamyl-tRNA reductase
MGNLQASVHGAESIRAREVRRLFNKLSLSPEQGEAIENFSRSLVEELVRGPIAKTLSENFSIKLEVGRIPPRMRLPI